MPDKVFAVNNLRRFLEQAFYQAGVPPADCQTAADSLLSADLQGVSTHGISRFPIYFRRLQKGLVNPKPSIQVAKGFPALLAIDGDNGLGSVVMKRSLESLIPTVEGLGIGAAAIKHSNHFGMAGYYCKHAAELGFISILFSNGPPALPPWGGREAYFGTNPIAFGFPRQQKPHIVVDLATSTAARGKIIEAANLGKKIPDNWALDKEGLPTTDPSEALFGVLLPMGGPKGYGLSLAVEFLSGVLTGAGFGKEVKWQYEDSTEPANVGHLVIVIKPDCLMDLTDYYGRVEKFRRDIKACRTTPGISEIKLPGENKWILEQASLQTGIKVSTPVAEELFTIAEELGLSFA